MKGIWIALLCVAGGSVDALAVESLLRHELSVSLRPQQHFLSVTDHITLPKDAGSDVKLHLHAGLNPEFSSPDGKVESIGVSRSNRGEEHHLKLPAGTKKLTVKYQGRIFHPLSSSRTEQARGFRDTDGIVDKQGVFLSPNGVWYPQLDGYSYLTFSMQVNLPKGWSSVSQGKRVRRQMGPETTGETWDMNKPQQGIWLIAGRFIEYSRALRTQQEPISAQVFLRRSDPKLADKYLDATARYLSMYEQLLGPYAYSKFALVENFWESGLGMPSFTLLGSEVIRLPFIVNSSYPHEILHNWWGNGVFLELGSGNWSEGLTAYLADHLIKQQQGQSVNYRLQTLQKYRDYAAENRDFPLTRFQGRHSSASEAVGYGKAMMLFHMLRNKVGDKAFTHALQQFYHSHFRTASFAHIERVFEQASGKKLEGFFKQWVERTGAPQLVIKNTRIIPQDNRFNLEFTIEQVQPGEAYAMDIPVAVTLEGKQHAHQAVVPMQSKQQTFTLALAQAPTRLDIDPHFDLFRELSVAETPPAFTQLFGSTELLVVLPKESSNGLKLAWQAFARDLSHMGPEQVRMVWDDAIKVLPSNQAIAVLGWRNRFAGTLQRKLSKHDVQFHGEQIVFSNEKAAKKNHAFAWVTRVAATETTSEETFPHALITADLAAALPGLGRKLPHYHKYSYLAFSGEEPENRLKGRWPALKSPMTVLFENNVQRARLDEPTALIEPVSVFDAERMM